MGHMQSADGMVAFLSTINMFILALRVFAIPAAIIYIIVLLRRIERNTTPKR